MSAPRLVLIALLGLACAPAVGQDSGSHASRSTRC